jgi:hypothetical protein
VVGDVVLEMFQEPSMAMRSFYSRLGARVFAIFAKAINSEWKAGRVC